MQSQYQTLTLNLSQFNTQLNSFRTLASDCPEDFDSQKVQKKQDECSQLLQTIGQIFKANKFNSNERLKVQKLKKDFERLTLEFKQQCEKLIEFKQEDLRLRRETIQNYRDSMSQTRNSTVYEDSFVDTNRDLVQKKQTQNIEIELQDNQQFKTSESNKNNKNKFQSNYQSNRSRNESENEKQQQIVIEIDSDLDFQQEMMEEKTKELQKIEKDVIMINNIQNDIAMMVHEDGQKIDIIEENLVNANTNVKQANKELGEAQKLQKSNKKKYCIALFLLLVIAGCIAVPIILSS